MDHKDSIIKTALGLFTRFGVKSITIARIVQQLHTSKRTIYQHFPDKTQLLRTCFDVYVKKIKEENDEIIQTSDNAIEAMGHLLHKILARRHTINPSFYSDILSYYPGLIEEVIHQNGDPATTQMLILAEWGIEDGLFQEDMDIEVVGKSVLHLLKLFKDNEKFPITEYSKERLTFGILIPYMRGLCTPKGLEILQQQEELFKISSTI